MHSRDSAKHSRLWNIREASNRAAESHLQSLMLSSHGTHLRNIDRVVKTGHVANIQQLETSSSAHLITSSHAKSCVGDTHQPLDKSPSRGQSLGTFRLVLPHCLSSFVWEIAIQRSASIWTFQLRPLNVHKHGSFVFDVIRSGDVEAVKRLISEGGISASDYESNASGSTNKSLLRVSTPTSRLTFGY